MLLRGMPHEGLRAFVDEYLGDERRPVVFGGREREFFELRRLAAMSGQRAVLCAGAGRGKSALLLRLAAALDAEGVAVAWAPVSLRFGTHRSTTVEALLSSRLRALTGREGHWRDALVGEAQAPLVVVIDGLDELQDGGLLASLRGLVPGAGVSLLVSARELVDRDGQGWADALGWPGASVVGLDPLSYAGVDALAECCPEQLKGLWGAAAELARELPQAQTRLGVWGKAWGELTEPERVALLPAIEEAAQMPWGVNGDEWFIEELSPEALGRIWATSSDVNARQRWAPLLLWGYSGPRWMPLRLLRRLGGPEAVLAWVRGVVGALRWFEAPRQED